jgi:hypothetical protein
MRLRPATRLQKSSRLWIRLQSWLRQALERWRWLEGWWRSYLRFRWLLQRLGLWIRRLGSLQQPLVLIKRQFNLKMLMSHLMMRQKKMKLSSLLCLQPNFVKFHQDFQILNNHHPLLKYHHQSEY